MKLIIDIPDETYNKMRRGETLYHADANVAIFAIETGIPVEECEDCISRQAAIDYFFRPYSNEELYSNIDLKRILEKLPLVTSAEKVGHWISNAEDDLKISEYTCSNCKGLSDEDSDFCPKCGSYNGGAV